MEINGASTYQPAQPAKPAAPTPPPGGNIENRTRVLTTAIWWLTFAHISICYCLQIGSAMQDLNAGRKRTSYKSISARSLMAV